MKKEEHETIIIGAGISGLACARKLHENSKEFLVISEDIGGRILTSEDGKVNYGAYFIMRNFHHVKKFVKIKRRIKLSKIRFHKGDYSYGIWNKKLLIYLPQLIRFLRVLYKAKKHYTALKEKCLLVSQAQALKSDHFLFRAYNQNANDFIHKYKIKDIAEQFISQLFRGLNTLPLDKLTAIQILWGSSFFIRPVYEFIFLKDEMIKDFKKDIIIDTVAQIIKKKDSYIIKTKSKNFYAKNVVVATPPPISKRLLHLKEIKNPVNVHIFHVSGKLDKSLSDCKLHFFSENYPLLTISPQLDGTFIILTKEKKPKFEDYFSKYKVIKHKYWNPMFNFEGNVLWECEQDRNLYLIGDHNITNLEDAYITGLYAANRILGKAK